MGPTTLLPYLKACKPAQWWTEIKQLSGFSKVERASPIADLLHLADEGEDPRHLANVINDAFLSPMTAFTPLAVSYTHLTLPTKRIV